MWKIILQGRVIRHVFLPAPALHKSALKVFTNELQPSQDIESKVGLSVSRTQHTQTLFICLHVEWDTLYAEDIPRAK